MRQAPICPTSFSMVLRIFLPWQLYVYLTLVTGSLPIQNLGRPGGGFEALDQKVLLTYDLYLKHHTEGERSLLEAICCFPENCNSACS